LTALISPIAVASQVVRKEIPILLGITLLSGALLWMVIWTVWTPSSSAWCSSCLMGWSIWAGMRGKGDALDAETEESIDSEGCLSRRPSAGSSWGWCC
jgi:cation:H+ antiporter